MAGKSTVNDKVKVKIDNVVKKFNTRKGEVTALNGVNLDIKENEFICVVGPSGCGKSTLLSIIAGLAEPTDGMVYVDGEKVEGPGKDRGVVFQQYALFPWLTVRKNVEFGLKLQGKSKEECREIAEHYLKMVDLLQFADSYPKELSGGMKQRVAIARAYAVNPKVLLMDEPFGALDAVTRARLQDLILKLWAQDNPKKTVFFVTHDVDEAMLLANRILVLGQSPSNIIYECVIPEDRRPTRENQFENLEMLKMRTELIRQINRDVEKLIE